MKCGTIVAALLLISFAPVVAAQPASKVWRVGWLGNGSAATVDRSIGDLRQGLQDLGYVEGKNFVIESRYANGDTAKLTPLSSELERMSVDVIVTSGDSAALAAKGLKSKIPVVVTDLSLDPVKAGLAASLGRPEGNVTGLATLSEELWGKRLALLKQVVPKISSPAVLWNPTNPGNEFCVKEIRAAALALGMQASFYEVRDAGALDNAFESLKRAKVDALVTCWDTVSLSNARRIADFALLRRLPLLAPLREYTEAGALISFGASLPPQRRRAAHYIDKILKGAKPASLPIEQVTQFELIPNQVTAKSLGLVFPGQILVVADDAIQ